jgi:hypothetical protein
MKHMFGRIYTVYFMVTSLSMQLGSGYNQCW